MSYIPPHRREKIMTKPDNVETPSSTKLYTEFFKKRREQKEKKQVLKKGWIILTKNGLINSLTESELIDEEEKEKTNNINKCMKKLLYNHEKDKELKYEKDGYISEELSCSDDYDDYDDEDENYVSNNEEDEYEDEEMDMEAEKYNEHKNKWASS